MLATAGTDRTEAPLTAGQPPARNRWEQSLRGRPLATDDFTAGAYARSKRVALNMREIAPDPEGWVRAIRHDLDRPDAVVHIGALVEAGELPAPSQIIENTRNGHAHVVWELGRWVRTDRPKATRFFERIRGALGAIIGADRAYAGKFQHNPLHRDFQTWGDWRTWELGELADTLGDRLWANPPVSMWGSRSSAQINPERAALGRNCACFEHVRVEAYKVVNGYRRTGDNAGFAQHVMGLVEAANASQPVPLHGRELATIARSITNWTWSVYGRGADAAQAHHAQAEQTREEYLRAQAIARREARRLRADGLGATAIAKQLGRSRSWVYVALGEAEAAPVPTVQSPPLSGDCSGSAARVLERSDVLRSETPPLPVFQRSSPPIRVVELAAYRIGNPVARAAFLAAQAMFVRDG